MTRPLGSQSHSPTASPAARAQFFLLKQSGMKVLERNLLTPSAQAPPENTSKFASLLEVSRRHWEEQETRESETTPKSERTSAVSCSEKKPDRLKPRKHPAALVQLGIAAEILNRRHEKPEGESKDASRTVTLRRALALKNAWKCKQDRSKKVTSEKQSRGKIVMVLSHAPTESLHVDHFRRCIP